MVRGHVFVLGKLAEKYVAMINSIALVGDNFPNAKLAGIMILNVPKRRITTFKLDEEGMAK